MFLELMANELIVTDTIIFWKILSRQVYQFYKKIYFMLMYKRRWNNGKIYDLIGGYRPI